MARPRHRRTTPRRPPRAAVAAVVVLGAAALTGCSSSGRASSGSGCASPRREALDPGYLQHVLPGTARQPTYASDPPTSGPHQPAPPLTGVVAGTISKPVQVGLLEAGKVVVQHRGASAADIAKLKALAGPQVVVAPAAQLPGGSTVVATAWTYKLACSRTDVAALKDFIAAHAGDGPNQR